MTFRYPGEAETEQIGKLIDQGHPGLFLVALALRQAKSVALAGMLILAANYAPSAVQLIKTVALADH